MEIRWNRIIGLLLVIALGAGLAKYGWPTTPALPNFPEPLHELAYFGLCMVGLVAICALFARR